MCSSAFASRVSVYLCVATLSQQISLFVTTKQTCSHAEISALTESNTNEQALRAHTHTLFDSYGFRVHSKIELMKLIWRDFSKKREKRRFFLQKNFLRIDEQSEEQNIIESETQITIHNGLWADNENIQLESIWKKYDL